MRYRLCNAAGGAARTFRTNRHGYPSDRSIAYYRTLGYWARVTMPDGTTTDQSAQIEREILEAIEAGVE